MKKYNRLCRLEIYLLFFIIFLAIVYFFITGSARFYIYIGIIYLISWSLTVIVIELILANISEKRRTKLKMRFKKKPKVFEYVFFLGLFWATALITEAYSRNIKTGMDFLEFLNTMGISIICYGVASACGWYHYIERLDDE